MEGGVPLASHVKSFILELIKHEEALEDTARDTLNIIVEAIKHVCIVVKHVDSQS